MANTAGTSAEGEFREAVRSRRRSVARRACAAGMAIVLAVAVSARLWASGDRRAGVMVLVAGAALSCVFALGAMRELRSDPRRWERAAAGERRTAELLAELSPRRWAVLHDLAVPGSRANIDHVVIGPTGVWLVDTKTTRQIVRSGWRSVWVGSRRLDPGPTAWEADVVADRLGVPVRALIALHSAGPGGSSPARGRRLPARGQRIGSGVRVIAADRLVERLRRGRRRLGRRDVDELFDLAWSVLEPRTAEEHRGARIG